MLTIYGLAGADEVIRYVGRTSDPERRLLSHHQQGQHAARHPDWGCPPVTRWIAATGPDTVAMTVLEDCAPELAGAREAYWIHTLRTLIAHGQGGVNRVDPRWYGGRPIADLFDPGLPH